MVRLACIVVPDLPHHVTRRGNRCAPVFFEDGDDALQRDLLSEAAPKAGTAVWSDCLVPNHVHLVLVPTGPDGDRRVLRMCIAVILVSSTRACR